MVAEVVGIVAVVVEGAGAGVGVGVGVVVVVVVVAVAVAVFVVVQVAAAVAVAAVVAAEISSSGDGRSSGSNFWWWSSRMVRCNCRRSSGRHLIGVHILFTVKRCDGGGQLFGADLMYGKPVATGRNYISAERLGSYSDVLHCDCYDANDE